RIAGRRKLVDHFSGWRAAIEDAGIGLFQNYDATALDPVIPGIDRRGDEIGEADVGDEAAALLHLQDGFLARLPLSDANLAVEHARVHADVRDGLSETEGAAPRLTRFPGLG